MKIKAYHFPSGVKRAQMITAIPEPDIPPMKWKSSEISAISLQLPELPDVKKERFMKKYGLSEYDAGQLTETRSGRIF